MGCGASSEAGAADPAKPNNTENSNAAIGTSAKADAAAFGTSAKADAAAVGAAAGAKKDGLSADAKVAGTNVSASASTNATSAATNASTAATAASTNATSAATTASTAVTAAPATAAAAASTTIAPAQQAAAANAATASTAVTSNATAASTAATSGAAAASTAASTNAAAATAAANAAVAPAKKPKIDWDELSKKLPSDKNSPEQKKQRFDMFNSWDANTTGKLSLSEVTAGLTVHMGISASLDTTDVIHCAFHQAKLAGTQAGDADAGGSGDFVEKREFRLLLEYVKFYLSCYQLFEDLDDGGDLKVTAEEFKRAVPLLEKWKIVIADSDATFKLIDKDGSGRVSFTEFAHWAMAHGKLDNPDRDSADDAK